MWLILFKLVCHWMICPRVGGGGSAVLQVGTVCVQFVLQVCTGSTACATGRRSSWLRPSGGACGWSSGWEGAPQQMFPVRPSDRGGRWWWGAQGAFDDTDEWIGDLSSPLPHTSLSRHVSVSARSIWWPSAPADLPCASKAGTGSAVRRRSTARAIFTPSTCQVCRDRGNK